MTARDWLVRVVVRRAGLRPGSEGAERVQVLRLAARAALALCARLAGARLGPLTVDERGAPVSTNGWHWSIAHTSDGDSALVAAAVARAPVGVDVERIHRRRDELVARVIDAAEAVLLDSDRALAFTRAWTAKEALLKKQGCGLAELSACKLVVRPEPHVCMLTHRGERHRVEHQRVEGYLAAVCVDGLARIDWTLDEDVREALVT
jgi:4'-phosphopantetheinyl transferase